MVVQKATNVGVNGDTVPQERVGRERRQRLLNVADGEGPGGAGAEELAERLDARALPPGPAVGPARRRRPASPHCG